MDSTTIFDVFVYLESDKVGPSFDMVKNKVTSIIARVLFIPESQSRQKLRFLCVLSVYLLYMTDTPLFLGLKLLHIFSIGCVGSAHFYLPTFYNSVLHLGADKIGFLASIIPFVSCLSFPLWMSWIDKNKQYKKTMVTNMLIGLLFILFIAMVPSLTTDEWIATVLASTGCLGYAFFAYPVIGIMLDSATIRVLNVRKRDLYGRQKAGTPIGFGSAVFLTGLSIELWGTYAVFATFTVFVLLFVLVCSVTNLEPHPWNIAQDENNNNEVEDQKHASMWDLIEQPQALKFFVVMTFLGTVMGVVVAFLFLFIEKDLHGSPALVGLLGPLASCTEVVCFYFAKDVFRWLGPRKMLIIAHMILALRCLIYAGATTLSNSNGAILAAVAQPLHGINFSLLWSAGVVEADSIAPPALKARSQGLLGTVYLGLGAGIGALLCGYVYEQRGAVFMWGLTMILTLVSLFTYISPVVDTLLGHVCGAMARLRRRPYAAIPSEEDDASVKDLDLEVDNQ